MKTAARAAEARGWQQSLLCWHTDTTNRGSTFRDSVGAAPWAWTLFPRPDISHPLPRQESEPRFHPPRGRRPSKKNPPSRCHPGRRPPGAPLVQWTRPSCRRAGGHRSPPTSWLQEPAGLFPSLRRNGREGCRWNQRLLYREGPWLDLRQQPSVRHSYQRSKPSLGRRSGLPSLSGPGEGPRLDTCRSLTQRNTLLCTVFFSEFNRTMCQTLKNIYNYIQHYTNLLSNEVFWTWLTCRKHIKYFLTLLTMTIFTRRSFFFSLIMCLSAGNERQNQSTRPESFTAESHEGRSESRRQVWQVVWLLMRRSSLKLILMRWSFNIWTDKECFGNFPRVKYTKRTFALCRDFTHYIEFINWKVLTVKYIKYYYTSECEWNIKSYIDFLNCENLQKFFLLGLYNVREVNCMLHNIYLPC